MRCRMWQVRRAGRGPQWNRLLIIPLVSLLALSALGLSLTGHLPDAAAHGSQMGTPLPTTEIAVQAFADTLAFPLRVDTQAELVAWEWVVRVDLRGVEDPAFLVALIALDQVVYTNAFYFGTPETSLEVRSDDAHFQVAPGDRNAYEITLRATLAQSLPPGDHWILLTVPDTYSITASATVAYHLGTMTFETGIVDDNDGKGFHPSDFHQGTAIDSGDILTEKSIAAVATRGLVPQERMVYFAFLRPGLGHWEYQDDFNGNIRTHNGIGTGGVASETPRPTLTAITTDPATVTLHAAVGVQTFEHPYRFITVDLDF